MAGSLRSACVTFYRDRLPDPTAYFEDREGLTLQRGGKWRSTECRFHGGSESMRVNLERGSFVCMSCGVKGGDVLAYHMQAHGQEFIEGAKALGAWVDEPRSANYQPDKPLPFRPRDALEVLRTESLLAAVAAGNMAMGITLTDADRERLLQAACRICDVAEAVGV
jgi:hypothetical protein